MQAHDRNTAAGTRYTSAKLIPGDLQVRSTLCVTLAVRAENIFPGHQVHPLPDVYLITF